MLTGHRPVVAVSLKMYFDVSATVHYCRAVAAGLASRPWVGAGAVAVGVLPGFLAIPEVQPILVGSGAFLGAQDLCHQDRGAFTGEVSGADLHEAGCSVVEVGHAERRSIFGEDDPMVAAKVSAALRNGLTPLLCVGESVRSSPDEAAAFCVAQALDALGGSCEKEVWLGYEPVWAIGAPSPAPVEYVRDVCTAIRSELKSQVPGLSILYGGSAGPGLLTRLWPTVDGIFLGRFAHDPDALMAVADEAVTLSP